MDQPRVAYWILFAAGIMPYFVLVLAKAHRGYDNANPRDPAAWDTPLRKSAHAAHLNCLEAFPLFGAAVLLAGLRQAPPQAVDVAAVVWLVFRLGYVASYLRGMATARSLTWFVASVASLAIFLMALLR